MNGLSLYTIQGCKSQIKLRAKGEAAWLFRREMAKLFDKIGSATL